MLEPDLVRLDEHGLACTVADVHIDPWRPVECAIVTHAHADHARPGSRRYVAAESGADLLRTRLGDQIELETHRYGEPFTISDRLGRSVEATFFPAGHVLGSAQVRLRADGYATTVITGDCKTAPDPTCAPFQPVECAVLVIEATFALPVYRWPSMDTVVARIGTWLEENRDRAAILFCYALGKAQRVMAELAAAGLPADGRPILCHGAVATLNRAYERAGVELPPWQELGERRGAAVNGHLVIAPPSAHRSAWMKRADAPATAFASGWMTVRGARRRRGYERGFVVSDHADWPGLLAVVEASRARRVYVTHGQNELFARFLREERGLEAAPLAALYEGESG